VQYLPSWLADWVLAEAEATLTPPDLAACLALALVGAALARKVRVTIRRGWTEPANVFNVVCLPPGERKSAVFAHATAPMLDFEVTERQRMEPIVAEKASEHRVMEAKLKALETKAAKAKKPAKGEDTAEDATEAEQARQEAIQLAKDLARHVVPDPPQLFCDDVTPEALGKLLVRQGGRMLLASAEGTAFEIAKGRYSETANFDVFLKGHAGDPLRVGRIGRDSEAIDHPALSCALAVQPDVISGLAEQATMRGRGFLARWLYSLPVSAEADRYREHREAMQRRHAEEARAGRDIGKLPDIVDLERRERCRGSLSLFCRTYNAEAFSLPWSSDHLRLLSRLEEAATHGALYAFACPRGTGKTTISRMACLWAVSYALRRYVYLIGSNATKAEDSLAAIKMWIRFLPLYGQDFPDVSFAIRALGGIANRVAGQLCQEAPTMVSWTASQITLPTVPPPDNWPRTWPLRGDGMVPTSGAVIGVSGLTGDGIRGSLLTLTTGEPIRPDLVLLDDPSTHESAHSPSQNDTREQLVSADVLGMGGPGRTISAVMPCTVIAKNDFIDRILDRKKYPLWRGERTRLLRSMPKNLAAWDEYFEVYRACALREPPDFAEANACYLGRRAELDEGAEASWPERKLPGEVSAIQHAMHLYCRDPRAYFAEYQNEPLDTDPGTNELTADQIGGKVNGLPRGRVPMWAVRLTMGVDVQGQLLFWTLAAWDDQFTGHIVAYGAFPHQDRAYFLLRDANPTLAAATGMEGEEARIFRGLTLLAAELIDREWEREDGQKFRVERALIDANWQSELIKQWVRQSGRREVLAAHGRYFGAGAKPIPEWRVKPVERKGLHWVVSRHVTFATNFWKSLLAARLATPQPEKGCLTLYGAPGTSHKLLADHLTSERRTRVEARERVVEEWREIPGRENHYLDALVLATVAASVQGSTLADMSRPRPAPRPPPTSYAAMQAAAKARQGR